MVMLTRCRVECITSDYIINTITGRNPDTSQLGRGRIDLVLMPAA
jgi:hypothetical protein